MLRGITAQFLCDGCGRPFNIQIDPATESYDQNFPAVFDLVEDVLAGDPFKSVQHGRHLCDACTRKVDAEVPESEDRNATEKEVERALRS